MPGTDARPCGWTQRQEPNLWPWTCEINGHGIGAIWLLGFQLGLAAVSSISSAGLRSLFRLWKRVLVLLCKSIPLQHCDRAVASSEFTRLFHKRSFVAALFAGENHLGHVTLYTG